MKRRVWIISLALSLAFAGIAMRLFQIQVIGSRGLSTAAVAQRAHGIALEDARGQICDRNRIPLTDSRLVNAVVFPSLVKDARVTALRLSQALGVDGDTILELISGGKPVVLKHGLSPEEVSLVKSVQASDVGDGVFVVEGRERYSQRSLARHVVGYVGAGGEGLAGIERVFNSELSGSSPGTFSVIVDAMGRHVPGLGYRLQGAGGRDGRLDVVLTIDSRIQAVVERLLDSQFAWDGPGSTAGAAVVVLDARTGDILALASRPDYDQSLVSGYLADRRAPLLNRAVSAYAPGSVFKIVTAAAAIEEGCVGLGETFICAGSVSVGPLRFECASVDRGGHGVLTFREALAESCNVAFIEVGQRIGAARLTRYARSFGFGSPTGALAAGESAGNVPAAAGMTSGDLANLSIGQWRLSVTPLQVAQAVTAIVNGGRMVRPTLVREVCDARGLVVRAFPRPKPVQVISTPTATWLRGALFDAARRGSASAAFVEGPGSAGKTGSAETGKKTGGQNVLHAWFAGYAPAYAPRYVCCVFVEEGGYGGSVAAPLFHNIMTELLRRPQSRPEGAADR